MDAKHQYVVDAWQKLKEKDSYDINKKNCIQRTCRDWNSFAKKESTSKVSSLCADYAHPNISENEQYPFILGTTKYAWTRGERQNVVNLATEAILQNRNDNAVEKPVTTESIHKIFNFHYDSNIGSSCDDLKGPENIPPSLREEKGEIENAKSMECTGESLDKLGNKIVFESNDSKLEPLLKDRADNAELATSAKLGCKESFPTISERPLFTDDEDLMKRINMDVNLLLDSSLDVRYKALLSMHCILLGDFPPKVCHNLERLSEEALQGEAGVACQGMFDSATKFVECVKLVTKPLLRKFADPSEKCRLLAISLMDKLLRNASPTIITLLSYILPVIVERLPIKSLPHEEDEYGKIEVVPIEASEEVRLALIQLLHHLLVFSRKKIKYFASEVASILTAAAMDNYHEVLLETFATMSLFGELCKQRLKPVAKQLIFVVRRSLAHKRHRVRVAAVKAIHRLVLCGAHDSIYELTAYRDPNLVPIRAFYQPCPKTQYLALLASDKSVQVREELLRTIASWLCELWERKEHECRLIPYILTGFTDENPSIQDLAFELVEKIGRQYEEENAKEVADVQVYLPEDIDDIASPTQQFLPRAFKSRPCLGARIMVRSCLAVMLHALSGDLDAWTSGTKALAADFLYTLLMFAEEHITMHLQPLVAILQKAFKEPTIEMQVAKCANVVGFFTDPSAYLKVISPHVSGEMDMDVSLRQLGANLKMLACIMHGTPSPRLTPHIAELCTLLTAPDLLTSIQPEVNDGIVAISEEMVKAYSHEECKEELTTLLWLLLNAAASSDFCNRPASNAEGALEGLSIASGIGSGKALIASQANNILDLLPHPTFWALRSLDIHVYCRVLQVAPYVNLETLPRIFRLLCFFGRGSWDIEIKQRLLLALKAMVSITNAADLPENITHALQQHMQVAMQDFFAPCLEDSSLVDITVLTLVEILSSTTFSTTKVPPSFRSGIQRSPCLSQEEKRRIRDTCLTNDLDTTCREEWKKIESFQHGLDEQQ